MNIFLFKFFSNLLNQNFLQFKIFIKVVLFSLKDSDTKILFQKKNKNHLEYSLQFSIEKKLFFHKFKLLHINFHILY